MSARDDFEELLQRSSLAEDQLWVQCEIHGRQPTHPFALFRICVFCAEKTSIDDD